MAKNISNDLDSIENAFKEICNIDINDGVNFDLGTIKTQRIKEDADYEGVRIKIIAYIGRARVHLQVDIGFGDVIIPKSVKIKYPVLLDFKSPEINAYSYDSVIAEKFEAMVYLAVLNSRMKDFYDIHTLLNIRGFDGRVLQEAIFETFQRRATKVEKDLIIFTEDFMRDSARNKQWKLFLKRIGNNNLEFKEVVKDIRDFIKPIYDAILKEEEFLYQWDYQNKEWKTYLNK